MRKFEPLQEGHWLIGQVCPACSRPFVEGDETTLVALGPGDDPEAQAKARAGLPYNAVAIPIHWTCSEQRGDFDVQDLTLL